MRRLPVLPVLNPAAVNAHAREAFAETWRRPRSAAAAAEIGDLVGAWSEEATSRARAESSERDLACAEGCSFCCHLKVAVTPPEAIALVAHINSLPAERRTEIVARVAAVDAVTRGMSAAKRAESKIACPLLEGGRCVAYAARPAACRAATSYDRDGCERAHHDPANAPTVATSPIARTMCDATRGAATATAMEAGLDGRLLELIAALRIGLERESAGEEWARGRPAFRFAVDAQLAAQLRGARQR